MHLLLVLTFVVIEDASSSGGLLPSKHTLWVCARIFGWEVVIDITKHAVLGKFNDIRPGIYREYMRDLCQDSIEKQTHNMHKLVRLLKSLCELYMTVVTGPGCGNSQVCPVLLPLYPSMHADTY